MNGEALAAALVERVAPLVPSGIKLRLLGGEVELSTRPPMRRGGRVLIRVTESLALRATADDAVVHACESFLDTVQAFVAETIAEPWPAVGTAMPMPFVTVSARSVDLGFVLDGLVFLAFPPIARDV